MLMDEGLDRALKGEAVASLGDSTGFALGRMWPLKHVIASDASFKPSNPPIIGRYYGAKPQTTVYRTGGSHLH